MSMIRTGADMIPSPKYGRLLDAMQRYSLGKTTMRKLAENAGAIRKVGGCVLYDYTRIDNYIDQASAEGSGPQKLETVEA